MNDWKSMTATYEMVIEPAKTEAERAIIRAEMVRTIRAKQLRMLRKMARMMRHGWDEDRDAPAMIVRTNNGVATVMGPDNILHQVPYEPLSHADMLLHARYHLWTRGEELRRSYVCRRCKEPMETDTSVNDEGQSWSLLSVCQCRAIYGTIPLSDIASRTRNATS